MNIFDNEPLQNAFDLGNQLDSLATQSVFNFLQTTSKFKSCDARLDAAIGLSKLVFRWHLISAQICQLYTDTINWEDAILDSIDEDTSNDEDNVGENNDDE